MRVRVVVLVALLLSACGTDPSAVKSFSALAPDASGLHTLTTAYADAPEKLASLDVLNYAPLSTPAEIAAQTTTRDAQVAQIDALHQVLIGYMQALGALASDDLVQTSSDTKSVTDGLTALQKASPKLGLTPAMITGASDLSTFLADAATARYRHEQLSAIIGKSEPPFQQLVSAEKTIVTKDIIPELQQVKDRINKLHEVTHALQVNAKAEAEHSKPQQQTSGVSGLDTQLQRSGAADIASLFLLQNWMINEQRTVDTQINAAKAYVTALDKISAAHTVLYANRDVVLTKAGAKATIAQLEPLVKEANTALRALKAL